MEKEAAIAAERAESSRQAAAVKAYESQQEADFSTLGPERIYGQEQQDRRAKMLVRNCHPRPDLCVTNMQIAGKEWYEQIHS